jgi:hypothetical protein
MRKSPALHQAASGSEAPVSGLREKMLVNNLWAGFRWNVQFVYNRLK